MDDGAFIFRRHGLEVTGVERLSIHGGSLRVRVQHAGAEEPCEGVRRLLAEERDWGVGEADFYRAFAARVEGLKGSLRGLLSELKGGGSRVAAYGAAAKGSTLLNYFRIGRDALDFVADRSTYKQGRFMPGVHVPVVEPARLLEEMPDYVLLLAWNFAEEILEQQAEYRRRGGRFIIPVPEVKVV